MCSLLSRASTEIDLLHSIGAVDPNTVVKVIKEVTEEDKRRQALMDARPPLDEILNLHDFEVSPLLIRNAKCLISYYQAVAKAVLPAKAWAYYSSASDDEITIRENRAAFQRYVNLRSILRLSWLKAVQSLVPSKNPPRCYIRRLVNNHSWMQVFSSSIHRTYISSLSDHLVIYPHYLSPLRLLVNLVIRMVSSISQGQPQNMALSKWCASHRYP